MHIITLESGRTRVAVAPEAGGRLHQIWWRTSRAWTPILHEPSEPEDALSEPLSSSSFVMAPWPNRVDGGRFVFDGRLYDVPVHEGDHGLHGCTVFLPWKIERQTATECRLSVALDKGWPFSGYVTQTISVRADSVRQTVSIHSGGARFPAGVGWHPWFRRSPAARDGPRVHVDADHLYETVGMIPTGWLKRVTREHDLRTYPPLGAAVLDTCYRWPCGDLRITLGDVEITMRSSANVRHCVVYTGVPHAIAIEPQTCAIDAFNLEAQGIEGNGTMVVSPGRPLAAWTEWRFAARSIP